MTLALAPLDRPAVPALRLTRPRVLDAALAGLNANTRRAYETDVCRFVEWLGFPDPHEGLSAFLGAGVAEAHGAVLTWLAEAHDAGLSPATLARRLAALKSVVRVARMLGDVTWTLELQPPKAEAYRDTRGPGADGWKALLATAQAEARTGEPRKVRDLAVLRLLHDLGLRRAELCALDLASLDLDRSTVAVIGKGHRQARHLTVPPPTLAAVRGWLAVRGSGPGALFFRLDAVNPGVGRLTGEAVRLLVAAAGRAAGLERVVRPHGLRHQAITSLLEQGQPVVAVMRFARHADPKTTMIYDDNRSDVAGQMAALVAGE